MKKVTIYILLLMVATTTFSQQNPSSPTLTKQDYLKKNKNQKTAAWVMLGGGLALGVGGAAWAGSDWEASGPGALMVIGGASVIGSIPLFIASGKNKRKAMSATTFFKMETAPQLINRNIVTRSLPSLTLKLSL